MKPVAFLRGGLWLTLGVLVVTGASAQQPPPPAPASTKLDPKALEVLKASSVRLAAARSMSFTATASYESPSRPGPALVYTTRSEVTVQRPDKLRVITPGDGPASEFYYDGKTMTAFAPKENLVAVAAAPPTIDAAPEAAYHSAAIYFPLDLLPVRQYLVPAVLRRERRELPRGAHSVSAPHRAHDRT